MWLATPWVFLRVGVGLLVCLFCGLEGWGFLAPEGGRGLRGALDALDALCVIWLEEERFVLFCFGLGWGDEMRWVWCFVLLGCVGMG